MYDINTDIYDAFRRQKNPFRAEKDYLECVILNRLFEEPYFYDNFIFTGGGTVSKIYKIGTRIGQDIDLAFRDFEDLPETRSTRKLTNFKIKFNDFVFDDLKPRVAKIMKDIGDFTIITDKQVLLTQTTGKRRSALPTLYIFYDSNLMPKNPMCIDLEFIPRHYRSEVIEYHSVVPYALQTPVSPKIPAVHFSQTFWDKVYALHVIHQKGLMRSGLSTHFYDVVNLAPSVKMNQTQHMFKSIEKYQAIYTTRDIEPVEDICKLNLMPKTEDLTELEKDYSGMSNRFTGRPESWQDVVCALREVNMRIRNLNQGDER